MGIESFIPRDRAFDGQNLEQKIANADVVSHKDVQEYAEFIIANLHNIKHAHTHDHVVFILDAISESAILRYFENKKNLINQEFSDEDTAEIPANMHEIVRKNFEENRAAIERIRKALVEELKGKIDEKIYLVLENLMTVRNRWRSESGSQDKAVDLALDIANGNKIIIKTGQDFSGKTTDIGQRAFSEFLKLPAHPNIVSVKNFDVQNNAVVYEVRNFIPLSIFLEKEKKDEASFIASLKVIRDCVKGAHFLEQNGLMLQDIDPTNLGVEIGESGEPQGVLFDLEGLVQIGENLNIRMGKLSRIQYMLGVAKHLSSAEKARYGDGVLDNSKSNPNLTSPYEQVYQFGCSLEESLDAYLSVNHGKLTYKEMAIIAKMHNLFWDMVKPCKTINGRLNLVEAEAQLSAMIDQIKREGLFVY